MKAAQYTEFHPDGKVDQVLLKAIDKPKSPKAGRVLVKICSASLNPADVKMLTGMFQDFFICPLPFIPGYDMSGIVDAVGKDVTDFNVGDETFGMSWGHDEPAGSTVGSTFAEYIDLPAYKLSHKPQCVSHDTASASVTGLTSLQVLDALDITTGKKILVLGGSAAVGSMLIQLAKLRGAHVVTTASTRAFTYASQFGADRVINYNEESWWLESHPGYDAVIDIVGEAEAFEHAQIDGVVKFGGSYLTIVDFSMGFNPTAHAPRFAYAAAFGARTSSVDQDRVIQLVAEGKLRVPIDEAFPFTQEGVTGIFNKLKGGKSLGKNVIHIEA